MADGRVPPETMQLLGAEHIMHEAHAAVNPRGAVLVHGHHARRFLSAVLERVQPEIDEL